MFPSTTPDKSFQSFQNRNNFCFSDTIFMVNNSNGTNNNCISLIQQPQQQQHLTTKIKYPRSFYNPHQHYVQQCPSSSLFNPVQQVDICSGSECCCSSSLSSSSSPINVQQQANQSFFNAFGYQTSLEYSNFNERIMASSEACSSGANFFATTTTTTGTFAANTVPNANEFHADPDYIDPVSISKSQFPGITTVKQGEKVEEDLYHKNKQQQQQWALVSQLDKKIQLEIDAQENFVCFIESDCHGNLSLFNHQQQPRQKESGKAVVVLIYANGSFHLKDLNSLNGTFINGRRVPSRCFIKLNEQDKIRFGSNSNKTITTDVCYQLKRVVSCEDVAGGAINYSDNHHRSELVVDDRHHQHHYNPHHHYASNQKIEPICSSSSATLSPMNKLFRKSLRIDNKNKNNNNKKDKINSVTPNTNAVVENHETSPSSFSLMSSSSNSSSTTTSSSSNTPTPSSVFKSAMKMMKMRFKKKQQPSNKNNKQQQEDDGLICSGNEDITFIRYDHHNSNHNDSGLGYSISVSAPESPSQPRSRIFHSHTYQDEFIHPRKLSAYQIGITMEEHEYDEVTHENDIDTTISTTSCGSDQQLTEADERSKISVNNKCIGDDDLDINKRNSTLCRKQISNSANIHEVLENDDNVSVKNVFDNRETTTIEQQHLVQSNDFLMQNMMIGENQMNSSSTTILPHLNSEDRLNNNSSLDMSFLTNTDSLIMKKCEMNSSNGTCDSNSCQIPDNSTSQTLIGQQQQVVDDFVNTTTDGNESPTSSFYQQQRQRLEMECHRTSKNIAVVMPETIVVVGDNFDVTSSSSSSFGSRISNTINTVDSIGKCTTNTVVGRQQLRNNVGCGNFVSDDVGGGFNDCYGDHFTANVCQQQEEKQNKKSTSFLEKSSLANNSSAYSEHQTKSVTCATVLHREVSCETTTNESVATDISEYDIDSIGHLRRTRPLPESTNTEIDTVCVSPSISPNEPLHYSLQSSNEENVDSSRHSVGGMAFVINFDNQKDSPTPLSLRSNNNSPSICESRNVNKSSNKLDESKNFIRLNSKRYPRNNSTVNSKNTDCEILQDSRQSNSPSSMKRSDTYDKNLNMICPDRSNEVGKEVQQQANNLRQSNYCSQLKLSNNKISLETTSDTASSKASSVSSSRRHAAMSLHQDSRSSAQLSESAVYLINRMFEDSDNYRHHRFCSNEDEDENPYVPYAGNSAADYGYGSRSHQSSGSESPYGIRVCNPTTHHIPSATLTNHAVCNSSSNASTRMEYDDSLSSLHSNSDNHSAIVQQRCRENNGMYLHQSMSTVVPSSPQSTLDKQVDSAIDDDVDVTDGLDLIADIDDPGELSDTGTYVVEIDNQGHKCRRYRTINQDKPKKPKSCLTKPKVDRSSDEDLPVEESDYCEEGEEENFGDEEEGEEDKLEVARKQIDELFSNYEKNQTQKQKELDKNNFPSTKTTNNATFTRSKRSNSQTTPHSDSFNHMSKMVVDDKCPQQICSLLEPTTNRPSVVATSEAVSLTFTDKSKKRISSELMSAFKRINSKLEKTARLGKLSLAENHKNNCNNNSNNTETNSPNNDSINMQTQSKPPLKSRSAPGTPLLSENRKIHYRTGTPLLTRKDSVASNNEYSSTERLDDRSTLSRNTRARSESTSSNVSNQSSNLRFNRAFALRRARLGMDTCGVEISEQAACKAKESQEKSQPKPKPPMNFRRNDGGRFSLRVSSPKTSVSALKARPQPSQPLVSPSPNKPSAIVRRNTTKPPTPTTTYKNIGASSKIPTIKSHSTSSSVCSSQENLNSMSGKMSESRTIRKRINAGKMLPTKISHSDNEISPLGDTGDSSCDESPSLFQRFIGVRSSLRYPSGTASSTGGSNSTPWLKSFKSPNHSTNTMNVGNAKSQPSGYPLFSSSNYHSASHQPARSEGEDHIPAESMDTVRSIPAFQVTKHFFSTKPHRMAQFDKEFSVVDRSVSANSQQMSADHNLMTHSVTESLLSRSNLGNSVRPQESKSNEHPPTSSAISSNINARIFSISPLDSLVISAINQLSSKLRIKMRDFLERERSNHLIGSEARTLIDEILPQVESVSNLDSRSQVTKSAYTHESSNISRDLSNILKNLKKVEQIFDAFSMLLEPVQSCQDVSNSEHNGVNVNCNPIITNPSDSDTSGDGNNVLVQSPAPPPGKQLTFVKSLAPSKLRMLSQKFQSPPSQQQQQSASSMEKPSRSGFFIEI